MPFRFGLPILLLFVCAAVFAQEPSGPYAKSNSANIAQKIIHLLDNMTVGSVQSVLGVGHIAVYAIGKPLLKGEGVNLKIHKNENEIAQLHLNEPVINSDAYSLGLVQIGEGWTEHEGGHAVQSAALGPLYLPTVAFMYLLEGVCCGTMEEWADLEAHDKQYMNTQKIQVGMGEFKAHGEIYHYLALTFSIDQMQDASSDKGLHRQKLYEWFNSSIAFPLHERSLENQSEAPVFFEISLLEKSIRLINRQNNFYLSTEQVYAKLENDPLLKRMHFNALDWQSSFGLSYDISKIRTKVSAYAGLNAGVSFLGARTESAPFFDFNSQFRPALKAGFQAGLNVNLFDYLDINTEIAKRYNTAGESSLLWSTSLKNKHRNPFRQIGFVQYFEFGLEHNFEKVSLGDESLSLNRLDALIGIRF